MPHDDGLGYLDPAASIFRVKIGAGR